MDVYLSGYLGDVHIPIKIDFLGTHLYVSMDVYLGSYPVSYSNDPFN